MKGTLKLINENWFVNETINDDTKYHQIHPNDVEYYTKYNQLSEGQEVSYTLVHDLLHNNFYANIIKE